MLSLRTDTILKSIVRQYIAGAVPVSSQRIIEECKPSVSSATIRNEMAYLEQEGYIIRSHHSAGSTPSDKGYRHYVDSLQSINLPLAEQRLISHLFHQVERKLEEWLSLTATLLAQLAENVAIVTTPKPADCQLKHLELVSLQELLGLIIIVLRGVRVKQQLITFDEAMSQAELTAIANKLNAAYSGLPRSQIMVKEIELSPAEQQITYCLENIMQVEDEREYEEPYLDGWHFMLNQPEFAQSHKMLALMELVEQRNLLKAIIPTQLASRGVQVIIGKENKAEVIHDYSIVLNRYGLPNEAIGTIGIVGPTRMPYSRAISTVDYLSSMLNGLAAELYEMERPAKLVQRTEKE